jgi:hypothetical protein
MLPEGRRPPGHAGLRRRRPGNERSEGAWWEERGGAGPMRSGARADLGAMAAAGPG